MHYRRLLPEPGMVKLEELLDSVQDDDRAERPYVLVNFVASADGRSTLGGRSGGLGDDGDREIFHGLRERADAVLAGTHTMRTERYGRLLRSPDRRARRTDRGLTPEPLACVITRSGDVPTEIPLFAEPEAHVVVFASGPVSVGDASATIEVVELDPGEATITTALRRLRSDHGVRLLLCEGGPTLFSSMLEEGVVDELFLTIAPKLAGGGTGPPITSGPELPDPALLRIAWLLERSGSLFARYRVIGS